VTGGRVERRKRLEEIKTIASLTFVQRIADRAVADLAFYEKMALVVRQQIANTEFGVVRVHLLRIVRKYDALARIAENFIRKNGWLRTQLPSRRRSAKAFSPDGPSRRPTRRKGNHSRLPAAQSVPSEADD
jgi:hypothetical protein